MDKRFKAPTRILPVVALLIAIGAFAGFIGFNHFAAPTAEATDGGFDVKLTNISANTVSGYTLTFTSDADFTSDASGSSVRITFPSEYDLSSVSALPGNYTIGDGGTNDEPPTSVVVTSDGPGGSDDYITLAVSGGANELDNDDTTDSNNDGDNDDAIDEDTINEGDDIVVVIKATAGVKNPNKSTDSFQLAVDTGDGNGETDTANCDPADDDSVDGCSETYGFGATITLSPNDPGVASRMTIVFAANEDLVPGEEIIIRFEDDWQVPSTMSNNLVTIRSTLVTNDSGCLLVPVACKFADQTVNPDGIRVDFVGPENDEGEISLQVPDLSDEEGSGANGILEGAKVTVIFLQSESGVVNPAEALTNDVFLSTSVDPSLIDVLSPDTKGDVATIARVELSDAADDRGSTETLLAIGVEGGESITFFLDQDGNGRRDAQERDLCTVVADRDDTASCTITLQNPPFEPGFGSGSCDIADAGNRAAFSCNFINFVDGENRRSGSPLALTQDIINRQKFNLEPAVSVSPESANVGDTITVSVFDFDPTDTLVKIEIANLDVTPDNFPIPVGKSGETSFAFTVPGVANNGDRVPTGARRFDVISSSGADNDTTLTISGANLSLSHSTVVANQDLTITGSGFSEGRGVCIEEGQITLNNVALEIDDDPDTGCANEGIKVTSGGTFTVTVRVHDRNLADGEAVNTALLTEGTHELKVIDSNGAEGTLEVTIPERSLEVTPLAARPRDVVTIIGRAFVADNADGVSTTVDIEYDCGGGNDRSVTADPDVSGNFRETLRIPSNCAIPSTNTITAKIDANGETGVVETVTHEIPEGLVTVEPGRGASGNKVTIRGEGFRTFETVDSIEFGGLGTLGGRTVNTDANGSFVIDDVVVPGLDPGIHPVIVKVAEDSANETSASTSFEVLESGLIGAPTPVSEAYDMSENLMRVFWFDNTNKTWQFNDRRPEFADANDLDDLVSGGVYWFLVDQDTELDVDGALVNLTCTGDDCWNLIVWP